MTEFTCDQTRTIILTSSSADTRAEESEVFDGGDTTYSSTENHKREGRGEKESPSSVSPAGTPTDPKHHRCKDARHTEKEHAQDEMHVRLMTLICFDIQNSRSRILAQTLYPFL